MTITSPVACSMPVAERRPLPAVRRMVHYDVDQAGLAQLVEQRAGAVREASLTATISIVERHRAHPLDDGPDRADLVVRRDDDGLSRRALLIARSCSN